MAEQHTCNSNMVSEYEEPAGVRPPKVIWQKWRNVTCDICGKLQSRVNLGTEER